MCWLRSIATFLLWSSITASLGANRSAAFLEPRPGKNIYLNFVGKVTKDSGSDFVAPVDASPLRQLTAPCGRAAVSFRTRFRVRRIKRRPQHPERKTEEPFKAVIAGDLKSGMTSAEKALFENRNRDTFRHHHRCFRQDRAGLAREGPLSDGSSTI